eukprot:m.143017 g.143017  ORF g.143017 m.143017 type:complete len:422 (-) comp17683_c0_seq2:447-1712(-)
MASDDDDGIVCTQRSVAPTCMICMESLEDDLSAISCGHVYHTICIQTWFQTKMECPACKRQISRDPPAKHTAFVLHYQVAGKGHDSDHVTVDLEDGGVSAQPSSRAILDLMENARVNRNMLDSLRTEQASTRAERDSLQDALDTVTTKMKKLEKENKRLRNHRHEVRMAHERNHELQTRLGTLTSEFSAARLQLSEAEAKLQTLDVMSQIGKGYSSDKLRRIGGEEFDEMNFNARGVALSILQQELVEATRTMQKYSQTIQDYKLRRRVYDEKLSDLEKENKVLKANLEQKSSENAELLADVFDLERAQAANAGVAGGIENTTSPQTPSSALRERASSSTNVSSAVRARKRPAIQVTKPRMGGLGGPHARQKRLGGSHLMKQAVAKHGVKKKVAGQGYNGFGGSSRPRLSSGDSNGFVRLT